MKKTIYFLSGIFLAFIGLLACDKADSNPVVELNKAKVTIDGVEVTEFIPVSQENSIGGYTIQLTGGTSIVSLFTNNKEVGVYPISGLKNTGAENSALATISLSGKVDNANSGTISITTIDGNGITGTFSFAANNIIIENGSFTNIEITNGAVIPIPEPVSKTVTDVEGNVYKTVEIGTQVWMAENLKTKKYANDDVIGTTSTVNISTELSPKYQWAYNADESKVEVYGRLYTWHAATDSRGLCPTGWHVPSEDEWTTLTTYLGGDYSGVSGVGLREVGTSHWTTDIYTATNETGFTGLPAGDRSGNDGVFSGIGEWTEWWSSTETVPEVDFAKSRELTDSEDGMSRGNTHKSNGISVRCIKNN
ncbi:MAG: FISUMP domain-containing protein [Bacteroidales bacterium]|nr:FISUMP domain-containing protein [Bacteroidales bacterium]